MLTGPAIGKWIVKIKSKDSNKQRTNKRRIINYYIELYKYHIKPSVIQVTKKEIKDALHKSNTNRGVRRRW